MIMHKRSFLLLLSFLLCSSVLVRGQETKKPVRLWLGFGAGCNIEQMAFIPKVQQSLFIGAMGGGIFRWDVEQYCSLQLETNYSIQGWRERFDDSSLKYARQFNYVEVPLVTHLFIPKSNFRFFVNMGPKIGYLLSEKNIVEQGDFKEFDATRHGMPVKNKLEWGLVGGLGVGMTVFDRLYFELEGRFNYNFNDIYSTQRKDPYGQASEMFGTVRLNMLFLLYHN